MSEINPWPLFGYAPGGYLIQCIKCNTNHHTGDKRAIICGDCAAVEAKSRIASLERERDEARQIVRDIHWMARRYADGRMTYAVGMFNDAVKKAFDGGWLEVSHDEPAYAVDGAIRRIKPSEAEGREAE